MNILKKKVNSSISISRFLDNSIKELTLLTGQSRGKLLEQAILNECLWKLNSLAEFDKADKLKSYAK